MSHSHLLAPLAAAAGFALMGPFAGALGLGLEAGTMTAGALGALGGASLGSMAESALNPVKMPEAPTAPTAANSSAQLDAAAREQAMRMQRGRASTVLTGGRGEEESRLRTSNVLLGQ